jgi:hypothetical protein
MAVAPFVIRGDRNDLGSYFDQRYLDKLRDIDLLGPELRQVHRANFCLPYEELEQVRYDPTKKWGMGKYPHDGKVHVFVRGKTREFILLGSQPGAAITYRLQGRMTSRGRLGGMEE